MVLGMARGGERPHQRQAHQIQLDGSQRVGVIGCAPADSGPIGVGATEAHGHEACGEGRLQGSRTASCHSGHVRRSVGFDLGDAAGILMQGDRRLAGLARTLSSLENLESCRGAASIRSTPSGHGSTMPSGSVRGRPLCQESVRGQAGVQGVAPRTVQVDLIRTAGRPEHAKVERRIAGLKGVEGPDYGLEAHVAGAAALLELEHAADAGALMRGVHARQLGVQDQAVLEAAKEAKCESDELLVGVEGAQDEPANFLGAVTMATGARSRPR